MREVRLMYQRRSRIIQAIPWALLGVVMAFAPAAASGGSQGSTILFERVDPNGVTDLWTMDADGDNQSLLLSDAADGDYSPNGRMIAFDRALLSSPPDIFVMRADGSGVRQLTDEPGFDFFPDWSPNGRFITFTSDRAGKPDIYRMYADGSNVVRLTDDPVGALGSVYSPNGKWIVYTGGAPNGLPVIKMMRADGSGSGALTDGPDFEPNWSPNGRHIAFFSARDGTREIYLMDADGGDQTRLTTDANVDIGPAAFSPNGKELAFMSLRSGNFDVYALTLKNGEERRLTSDPAVDGFPEWRQGHRASR